MQSSTSLFLGEEMIVKSSTTTLQQLQKHLANNTQHHCGQVSQYLKFQHTEWFQLLMVSNLKVTIHPLHEWLQMWFLLRVIIQIQWRNKLPTYSTDCIL